MEPGSVAVVSIVSLNMASSGMVCHSLPVNNSSGFTVFNIFNR